MPPLRHHTTRDSTKEAAEAVAEKPRNASCQYFTKSFKVIRNDTTVSILYRF